MRHTFRVVVPLTVVALLAGCGGDDSSDAAATQPATQPSAPSSTASEDSVATTNAAEVATSAASGDAVRGASADWDGVVAAANSEGVVNFYGSTTSDWVNLEAAFESDYPDIELQITTMATSDLNARLDQEREIANGGTTSGADFAINPDPLWYDGAAETGDILPIEVSPDTAALWADLDAFDGHATALAYGALTIAYNTDLLEELGVDPPKSIEDVLVPELKGNIGGLGAQVATTAGYQYKVYNELVDGFLDKFKAQDPAIVSTGAQAAQEMAAGEFAVGLAIAPKPIIAIQAEGAPVDYVVNEGALLFPYTGGVPSWAEHPNAAMVFMDWLMSEKGNQIVQDELLTTSALPGLNIQLQGITESGDNGAFVIFDPAKDWSSQTYQDWLAQNWTPLFG